MIDKMTELENKRYGNLLVKLFGGSLAITAIVFLIMFGGI